MSDMLPDKRVTVGRTNVDLWRGFIFDEVCVWVDVRPALGGLLGRKSWLRHKAADDLFAEMVDLVTSA